MTFFKVINMSHFFFESSALLIINYNEGQNNKYRRRLKKEMGHIDDLKECHYWPRN